MPDADRKQSFDVVVVGAGVIGLACAWRAAQRGRRGRRARARRAGRRRDRGRGGDAGAGRGARLRRGAAAGADSGGGGAVPGLRRRAGGARGTGPTGYERCGALHVALDRDEAEELRRRTSCSARSASRPNGCSPRECRQLEPGLAPSMRGGVHAPGEAAVDPRALARRCWRRRARRGPRCAGCEVERALIEGGRIEGVATERGGAARRRRSCSRPAPGPARRRGCRRRRGRRCGR